MDFLILALPRSGTAWVANFLTYGDVYCYHEPGADRNYNLKRVAPVTGCIDTAAYLFPVAAPIEIVLTRNAKSREASLRRLSPAIIRDDYELFARRTKGLMTIDYSELFNLSTLEHLWYTVASTTFNKARAEMLIEMNIQRDFDALVRRVGRSWSESELSKLD